MSLSTLGVDAYQLSTLIAHADAGRLAHDVTMSFFFRKLPRARNYVVFCGLRALVEHAAQMRLEESELATLLEHPMLGPALRARPQVMEALRQVRGFRGDIDALPEGTFAYAGPGRRGDGKPLLVEGAPVSLYTPLLQVRTDLVRSKLIETPWLGRINHLSMVASKAARVADAASGKPVYEFGQRRTHPDAAVDASYAAYIAGCAGSSNVAAQHRFGVPASGTMDHFFVQASERAGVSVEESEREAFALFARTFPGHATMLVDTYDTERGIRNAVLAAGPGLGGIRLDSNVTPETVQAARRQLDALGASSARILVSDGLDEHRVKALQPYADAFGVGENITTSPDSPVGIGCVAKIVVNGYGKVTMKVARGTGKATLPGRLQVWRYADHDLVALEDEASPTGGRPLLEPLWRGDHPVAELSRPAEVQARVRAQFEALPQAVRALEPVDAAHAWPLVASDALVARITSLVREAKGVT